MEKNCEFEDISASELLSSDFMSFIGKSTGDYELKKKIRQEDMTVEARTDAVHEYLTEKMNETTDSEDGKTVQYGANRNTKQE